MSDHDATPDPIDQAYVQAQALLDDEAARAERRARVLAAVAADVARPLPVPRRILWGHGRWLAAASVAGIGLLIGLKFYQPAEPPPAQPAPVAAASAPAAPVADAPAATAAVTDTAPAGAAPAPTVASRQAPSQPSAAPPPESSGARESRKEEAPAPVQPPPQFAAAPPPPPPPPARPIPTPTGALVKPQADANLAESVVTSERRAAAPPAMPAPVTSAQDFARAAPAAKAQASDKAAGLRAAAAAGRTSDITALLGQGAGVDAVDEAGDTALIKAVRANQPAAAALLLRRGADLDLKNRAGQSARDIAAALGDRALNRALGL